MSLTSPDRGYLLEHIDFDSGSIEALHGAIVNVLEHAGDARLVLGNIEGGLEGRGAAIRDATADAGEIADRIRPTVGMLRRISVAVRGYGEAVAQHARTANDLVPDIEAAHRAVGDAESAAATAQAREGALSSDASDAETARAASAVETAEEDLAARRRALADLWAAWEAAYGFWDDAYGQALASIANVESAGGSTAMRAAIDALANADSPAEVAEIWAGLTDAQRDDLISRRPEFVGNLEGVPYATRFEANRAVYDETIAAGPYGDPLDSQFEQLGIELDWNDGELLMFHPFEQPQATAAVVYDVRRDERGQVIDPFAGVTNVNMLVGGMFSGLGDLEAWGQSARDLNDYAEAYGTQGTGSVSIAWYGYDSPNLVTEHTMGSATEGAARLAATLRGLDAEVSSQVTTSVIGHSYGSTTAFLAVGGSPEELGVDRLIAVGSAGVPDGYHAGWTGDAPMDYTGTEIYATRAPWDFVARYGEVSSFGHGTDPADLPGATTFESDGGTAPALDGGDESVLSTPGHASHDGGNSIWGWWEQDNGYLARDSESFRNIANIVANGEVLQ